MPGIDPRDQRRLDGVISGLPIFGGKPIVIDATIRAPLTGGGLPAHGADRRNGAVFEHARRDKEEAYPELHNTGLVKIHYSSV